MYQGYTESPEKIARRKARICAGAQVHSGAVTEQDHGPTEAESLSLADSLLQTIEQARGELDLRKPYARQVTP